MPTSDKRLARPLSWSLLLGSAFLAVIGACTGADDVDPPDATGGRATGGAGATGGAHATGGETATGGRGTGGTVSTGGTSTGGASTGGASTTGGAATGGAVGQGGASTGGRGGAGPMGGAATGGTATGGAGGATSTTGKAAVQASSGCGKTNPKTGSSGSPLSVSSHMYYVKLPSGYNGTTPYPVIFMFNPTNNPISWAETSAGFEQNGAKDAAIRVYPHPQNPSSGWGAGDVSFFQPLYDQVTSNFCIDKARAFASGESSGGDFSSILGCEHANKLRSVGPCSTKDVPNYPLNASSRKCTGQVTPVVIQGKNDNVVGPANGPKTRDFYLALNHCKSTFTPVTGFTDTLSNCVQYDGCDAGYPVYWCQHTDPNYGGTNHGWPAFAPKFLWQLWSSY